MPRDVIMPALGMAQKTGSIVRWRKQPGEAVKAGDVLMEVETDKAVMEVEADVGWRFDRREGGARRGDPGRRGDRADRRRPRVGGRCDFRAARRARGRAAGALTPLAPPLATAPAPSPRKSGRIFASPRARRLAAEQRLDLAKLAEAGEPQPYLVRHLAALRALCSRTRSSRNASRRGAHAGFAADCDAARGLSRGFLRLAAR